MTVFPESPAERMEIHLRAISRATALAQSDKPRLHIPSRIGQWTRDSQTPFHAVPELFLQIEGSTRFQCPGETFRTAPGDLTIIGRGVPHREHAEDGRRRFVETVVVFRETGFLLLLARRTPENQPITGPADIVDTPHVAWLTGSLELIVDARCRGESPDAPFTRGLLLAILGRVLEETKAQAPRVDQDPPLVVKCRDLIEADFTNSALSVLHLARQLECSPDHLSRAYHSATGERLIMTLHRRRIAHAKALLRDSSLRISEIAWASGFESPSYFDRLFTRYAGVPPREFRRLSLSS